VYKTIWEDFCWEKYGKKSPKKEESKSKIMGGKNKKKIKE